MHLERAHRRDDDHGIGRDSREAALDVKELLRAEVGAEARLRHDNVGELQGEFRRHDAVAAVRDVRKGTAVDEDGRAFERLHDIGLDGILEEKRQRARRAQLVSTASLAIP